MPKSTPPSVHVRRDTVTLPTFRPARPDRNPMFLEKRVYQGSSGRVYPLPFYDRISEEPEPCDWEAVYVENEYLLVMVLPQLGGRIHRLLDKTSGEDLIYHQTSIKPALVGLAGPWVSGGIEFNWPQHHRPSTCMPADVEITRGEDGSVTVWLSEHDPMARMKGMHGVCLRPGRAVLELKVRVHNRTGDVQTFLWWANLAARVHESYQSFFPPDAVMVADHAKRATSSFPECSGVYYGVDYARRAREGVPEGERPGKYQPTGGYPANDLSWYANIPVPTSYMCLHTEEDFFGGYDHRSGVGIVHVADRHVSPGKKQWTWGNHDFGYAWDRNLTVPDEKGEHAPYIELMAGVYTDNQPDFSFLQPGETKTWSQYWYPIRGIGPAQKATLDLALSLRVRPGGVSLGVSTTRPLAGCVLTLRRGKEVCASWKADLAPAAAWTAELALQDKGDPEQLEFSVVDTSGGLLAQYRPQTPSTLTAEALRAAVATELPPPSEIRSVDELHVSGLHLEQYRHATRKPEDYWLEGLARDPGDSRCNLALGRQHLRRGEFAKAEAYLRASLGRLTLRNPNPADGESSYQLGRCLRLQRRDREACDHFAKAAWNQAWASASQHALGELACTRQAWTVALAHLDRALELDLQNLRARDLRVLVLRRLDRCEEADAFLRQTLDMDPLDWWARSLSGDKLRCDTQVRLDLVLDHERAGLYEEALCLLSQAEPEPGSGTAPLLGYYKAWLCLRLGRKDEALEACRSAREADSDYCFPARLEEQAILQSALSLDPGDSRAALYLGHWLYDRGRHEEAIRNWERCVRSEPGNAVAWRNLGVAYFNVRGSAPKARRAYECALRAAPQDARLVYERDQLWKRTGLSPARRLRALETHLNLVRTRDDLSLEMAALYNQAGAPRMAQALLASRRFQPWEGGEGQALRQHVRTHLLLSDEALRAGRAPEALDYARLALEVPESLGEAPHLLANRSDVHFQLGETLAANGQEAEARSQWQTAATMAGDFQDMRVRSFSELSYYTGLALRRLGREKEAGRLFRGLLDYAAAQAVEPVRIDYFATSLPDMLLFVDDLELRRRCKAAILRAQALLGLGRRATALRQLKSLLALDPNHPQAADLLRQFATSRKPKPRVARRASAS